MDKGLTPKIFCRLKRLCENRACMAADEDVDSISLLLPPSLPLSPTQPFSYSFFPSKDKGLEKIELAEQLMEVLAPPTQSQGAGAILSKVAFFFKI